MKIKILLCLFLLNLTSCSSDNSLKNDINKSNLISKNNSSIVSSGVVDKNVSDRNTINDKKLNDKPVQADTLVLNPLRPYLESTPSPNYNNSNSGSSSNSYSNTSPLAISDEKMTWHHHQDLETLQLVPLEIHKRVGHRGGEKIQEDLNKSIKGSALYDELLAQYKSKYGL